MIVSISKKIVKELSKLNTENCGFIFGKKTFFLSREWMMTNIHKVKNRSRRDNEYMINVFDVLCFIFKNFSYVWKKDCLVIPYHVHSLTKTPSKKDEKNMISGIIYAIVYKKKIYLYKKIKDVIFEMKYKEV
jgi:hypothetical protein